MKLPRYFGFCSIAMTLLAGCSTPNETLVTQRYDISDLMFVPTDSDIDPNTAGATTRPTGLFDESAIVRSRQSDRNARLSELQQYITENVEPDTWKDGSGRIVDGPADEHHTSLLITQTPEAHQKVEVLFDGLRNGSSKQISVSVGIQILDEAQEKQLPDELQHRLSLVHGAGRYRRDVFLSAANVSDLRKATTDDRVSTNSLGPPTYTLFSGQHAALVVQTQQAYIANLKEVKDTSKDDKARSHFEPDIGVTTSTGISLPMTVCCTQDAKTAFVDLNATIKRLLGLLPEQLASVPPEIPAVIQRPVHWTLKLNAACAIPDDATLLLSGPGVVDSGDPALNAGSPSRAASDAEVKRLTNQEVHRHVYLLIHAKIITQKNSK